MQKFLSKMVLPLVAFGFIAAGLVVCTGILTDGVVYVRPGIGLIALGVAVLGYWALSSENKDYNF